MKLSEYRKKGDEYTSKASEIVRQMLLGGIGMIWLLKETENGATKLDGFLLYPLLTICIALIFDLLQYVVAGFTWKKFYRMKEKEISIDQNDDIKAPKRLSDVIYLFYWLKIGFMLVSYMLIIYYINITVNFS